MTELELVRALKEVISDYAGWIFVLVVIHAVLSS